MLIDRTLTEGTYITRKKKKCHSEHRYYLTSKQVYENEVGGGWEQEPFLKAI